MKLKFVLLSVLSLFPASGCFSITLASNGKTDYSIIIPVNATGDERHAADVLAKYLKQITEAEFLIHPDQTY